MHESYFYVKQRCIGYSVQIGCGSFTFDFVSVNTEIDPTFKIKNSTILIDDITQTSLPLNSFDTVLLLNVLEHCPDPFKVMKGCISIMKEHGKLIISVPSINVRPHLDNDYWRFLPMGLDEISKPLKRIENFEYYRAGSGIYLRSVYQK